MTMISIGDKVRVSDNIIIILWFVAFVLFFLINSRNLMTEPQGTIMLKRNLSLLNNSQTSDCDGLNNNPQNYLSEIS